MDPISIKKLNSGLHLYRLITINAVFILIFTSHYYWLQCKQVGAVCLAVVLRPRLFLVQRWTTEDKQHHKDVRWDRRTGRALRNNGEPAFTDQSSSRESSWFILIFPPCCSSGLFWFFVPVYQIIIKMRSGGGGDEVVMCKRKEKREW